MLNGIKLRLIVSLLAYFGLFNLLNGQELSRSELEVYADDMYQKGQFEKAYDSYEKLYNIYPNEVKYSFLYGRALLRANHQTDYAIELLRKAASQNYSPATHYYLALGYYHNYQLDEAEIALWNFKNLSKKKEQINLQLDHLEAAIKRARGELYNVRGVHVQAKQVIPAYQKEHVFVNLINGKIAPMPSSFMLKQDIALSYQGYMFYPESAGNGDNYIISSYGKNGNQKKDLYVVEQLTVIDFSVPEALEVLNSKWNEEYPYFDEKTQTLYFSSDRIGGLGGYDIYKASYVAETKSFNMPERLEFPINTPHDDFLFVPDSLSESAVFLSNRDGGTENYTAYTLDVSKEPTFLVASNRRDILDLARLDVTEVSENMQKDEPTSPPVLATEPTNYDILIQQALLKQLKCDSLHTELMSETNKLRITTDKNERRVIFSSIAHIERLIDYNQPIADSLFAEAYKVAPQEPDPELLPLQEKHLTVVSEVNGLKVFNYKLEDKNKNSSKVVIRPESNKMAVKEIDQKSDFAILDLSPYNEVHPIPDKNELPEGLVYRIQLGAFGKKLPMDSFGGLSPLTAEFLEERNITKYYVGYFASSKEARKALGRVKDYGYSDAFIVPYIDKKKVSINEARTLEFGQKSFAD